MIAITDDQAAEAARTFDDLLAFGASPAEAMRRALDTLRLDADPAPRPIIAAPYAIALIATACATIVAGQWLHVTQRHPAPGQHIDRMGACDLYARKGPKAETVLTLICPPGQSPASRAGGRV